MNIPDHINYVSADYESLCFTHAVSIAMTGISIDARLEEEFSICCICSEEASIRSATADDNRTVWTRQMLEAIEQKLTFLYDLLGTGKRIKSMVIRREAGMPGNRFIVEEESGIRHYEFSYIGKTTTEMLKWLNAGDECLLEQDMNAT